MKSRSWHLVQISTLGLAGLLALLVGIARTPALENILPKTYFQTALVGHVDLFLVVWYVIIPIMFLKQRILLSETKEKLSFALMLLGVIGMIIPSVFALGQPVMANYVPFIVNPLFFGGFATFMGGITVIISESLRQFRNLPKFLARAILASVLCYLGTILSIVFISIKILIESGDLLSLQSLTQIFWLSGHLLQFAHVSFMLLIWAEFFIHSGISESRVRPIYQLIQFLPVGVIVGFMTVFFQSSEELLTQRLLTNLKSYGVGIPAAMAALYSIWLLISSKNRPQKFQLAALVSAISLLILGGVIAVGLNLQIQTTLIPAHYHAVLTSVAVTFMGYVYLLLEKEKVHFPNLRLRTLQPYLYGFGTFALVAGMAWAGLHNAPRKTPGLSYIHSGDINLILSLYLWGVGVILSVIGGFAYLVTVTIACFRWKKENHIDQGL